MLEHPSGLCRSYSVLGVQGRSCAQAHLDFVRERAGRVIPIRDLDRGVAREILGKLDGPIMASFDLDAVDQAFAPGVSAPAAGGLNSREWLDHVFDAGATASVSSVDFVEVSPVLDRDSQTSRLAAAGLWSFLSGMSQR